MSTVSVRRLKRAVGNLIPSSIKPHIAAAYDRIEERRANSAFEPAPLDLQGNPDRDVVLIVVDALRFDRIGRDIVSLPNRLDSGQAVSPAPWTFPAVSSILTGQYPHEHGAMRQSDNATDVTSDEFQLPPVMDDNAVTLPTLLANAGYDTFGAFGFHMPFLALRGQFSHHRLFRDCSCEQLLSESMKWISSRSSPTFSYLHLSDLHEPVDPPETYWREYGVDNELEDVRTWDYLTPTDSPEASSYREHRERLYDAAAAYVDDVVDEYVAEFERILDDPLIVVTSDHGEAFWEHTAFDAEHFYDSRPAYGVAHGGTPYESIARVPVLSNDEHLSDFDGERSLIDVAPTLLDALGVSPPSAMTGHAGSGGTTRPLLVEAARYGHEKKAVYESDWKLVISKREDTSVGFELPSERRGNVPAGTREEMERKLPPWPDSDGDRGREVSDTARKRLENLGYK